MVRDALKIKIDWEQTRTEQGTWVKEVKGDKSKIHVVNGKIQISFFVGSATAAKFTPEGEGLAGEGWDIKSDVIAGICTEFSEHLFLRPSSTRSDAWVGFPALFLTAMATDFSQF